MSLSYATGIQGSEMMYNSDRSGSAETVHDVPPASRAGASVRAGSAQDRNPLTRGRDVDVIEPDRPVKVTIRQGRLVTEAA